MKSHWIICGIFFLFSTIGAENFFIPVSELKKHGVEYTLLEPVNLSPKGNYFVASEAVKKLDLKMKGITRILKVIYFKDKKVDRVDSVSLKIIHTVNITVSDTKDEVMVIGNHGTKLIKVDLQELKATTIYQHKKNKRGFKSGPLLICHRGEFYCTGWFYDAQQFWKGDFLVHLKFSKNKKRPIKFVKRVDTKQLFTVKDGRVDFYNFAKPHQIYYKEVIPKERMTYLKVYSRGKIKLIDKAFQIRSVAGTDKWVFYCVKYTPKTPFRYFVKNFSTNEVTEIGDPHTYYTYPFAHANTLIVNSIDIRTQTFDGYVGKLEDKFKLKLFLSLSPMGAMKLSPDGKTYLLMTKKGLKVGTFEEDKKEK